MNLKVIAETRRWTNYSWLTKLHQLRGRWPMRVDIGGGRLLETLNCAYWRTTWQELHVEKKNDHPTGTEPQLIIHHLQTHAHARTHTDTVHTAYIPSCILNVYQSQTSSAITIASVTHACWNRRNRTCKNQGNWRERWQEMKNMAN